jgi:hypothetical protein
MSNKIKLKSSNLQKQTLNALLLSNEITFLMAKLPTVENHDHNHLMWFKSNKYIPDIVVCNKDKKILISPKTFLKDGDQILYLLAQKYKYSFGKLEIQYEAPEINPKQILINHAF